MGAVLGSGAVHCVRHRGRDELVEGRLLELGLACDLGVQLRRHPQEQSAAIGGLPLLDALRLLRHPPQCMSFAVVPQSSKLAPVARHWIVRNERSINLDTWICERPIARAISRW